MGSTKKTPAPPKVPTLFTKLMLWLMGPDGKGFGLPVEPKGSVTKPKGAVNGVVAGSLNPMKAVAANGNWPLN